MNETGKSLTGWLDAATAGLPVSASDKFRAEIADHFAESIGTHVGAGLSADDAERAALAALGDPQAVGRRLRDGHFSRREYMRGGAAVLAMLLISLVGAALGTLSDARGPGNGSNPFRELVWKWDFMSSLAGCILLIVASRAILTLLKEQYDIHVPSWGWRLYVACLLAVLPAGLLIPAIVWVMNFSPFASQASFSAPMNFAFGILPALQGLHIVSALLSGSLLLAFFIKQRVAVKTRAPRAQRILALLVTLCGLSGVGSLVTGLTMFATIIMPLPYPQNVPGMMFSIVLAVVLPYVSIALLAVLAWMFFHMHRPGAVLAG